MNLFKIVIKDLKEFIMQKNVVFIILILSLVISSYGFLFFTSSNINILELMNEHKGEINNYFVYKENFNQEDIERIVAQVQKENIDITYHIFSNIQIGEKVQDTNKHIKSEKQLYNLVIGSNKAEKSTEDFVGKEMQQKDRDLCSNYIMIKDTSNKALNDMFILNKEISLNNKHYVVRALDQININVFKYLEYINSYKFNIENINDIEIGIIPDTTFYKEKYTIYGLEMILPKDISEEDRMMITNLLKNEFSNDVLILPNKVSSSLFDDSFHTILYIILMIMALVNIMALFAYWIDKNWRKYMVYRLCGANNLKLYGLIVMEALIIAIISIVLSVVMYYCSLPLLKMLNINYMLNISEILIITIIILILVYMNIHKVIKNMLRTEIRYLGKR